jgi:hypothetical protein
MEQKSDKQPGGEYKNRIKATPSHYPISPSQITVLPLLKYKAKSVRKVSQMTNNE